MGTTRTPVEARRLELEAESERLRAELRQAQDALDKFTRDHPKMHDWAPRFREAREALGVSRAMLGRIAGVSPTTIRHAELGDRDLTLRPVLRLANVLGVTPGWLIMGEEAQS